MTYNEGSIFQFDTVGDLIDILKNYPEDTPVRNTWFERIEILETEILNMTESEEAGFASKPDTILQIINEDD